MTLNISCTWIGLLILFFGSIGNWLCIGVFCRKRFRSQLLTPFFVALLIADCVYLNVRFMKLLYYQQTLFNNLFDPSSCSTSFLLRFYSFLTQKAPQYLIPFCHYEFYIRFSLILMSFLAVQRAYDIFHSSYHMKSRNVSSRTAAYILITSAFCLSYLFEFLGLNLFCSYELSSTLAYQWFNYIQTNLTDEIILLKSFIQIQTNHSDEIDCIFSANQSNCSQEHQVELIRRLTRSLNRSGTRFRT